MTVTVYRTAKGFGNPPSCITRNVLERPPRASSEMSPKGRPPDGQIGLQEEGCGGPVDGRAKGTDQGDAQAVREGIEGREGPSPGRAVRPDRMDPPARQTDPGGRRPRQDRSPAPAED